MGNPEQETKKLPQYIAALAVSQLLVIKLMIHAHLIIMECIIKLSFVLITSRRLVEL
jgi:hypothetical protein